MTLEDTQATPGGEDSDQHSLERRKAAFIEAVTTWTAAAKERRVVDSMTRHELAALDSLQRLIGQRQSLIENLAHLYRAKPGADVAPGLLALITFLSDNNDGCCTLGVGRMAQLFARNERRVRDALERLEEEGCIRTHVEAGKPKKYWPVVNRLFGDPKAVMTWFVDAHSPTPAKPGRPRKTPAASDRPFPQNPRTDATAHFDESEKNPGHLPRKPRTDASTDTTRDSTDEEEAVGEPLRSSRDHLLEQSTKAAPDAVVTVDHIAAYSALVRTLAPGTNPRSAVDQLHRGASAFCVVFPCTIVEAALQLTLAEIAARIPEFRTRTAGALASYFVAIWRSRCGELVAQQSAHQHEAVVASSIAEITIDKARRIAHQGVQAHAKTIERGQDRRAASGRAGESRRYVVDGSGRERFRDDVKLGLIAYHQLTGVDGNAILEQVPSATTRDVEATLVEISDDNRLQAEKSKSVPIKKVHDVAIAALAHKLHGTPQERCVGPVATSDGAPLVSSWAYISAETLAQLRSAHPKALIFESDGGWELRGIWRAVEVFARERRATYGNGLQEAVEDEFARRCAEAAKGTREWFAAEQDACAAADADMAAAQALVRAFAEEG